MDPRVHFYSNHKQRHNNPSLRSQLMSNNFLHFTGGPLNVQPRQENTQVNKQAGLARRQPSFQHHAALLLAQSQADRERSMLRNSNEGTRKGEQIKLDLPDRDRYYFKRTGSVDHSELLARNSMGRYLQEKPVPHDKIFGRHSVNPPKHEDGSRYMGYSNFSPKLLTNADEIRNIIFGI